MASTSKRQFEEENGRSGGIVEFMARFSDERADRVAKVGVGTFPR